MPQAAWKRVEQRLAQFFGSTRRPLSGGNSKTGRDDSLHPVLFLECKHGKSVPCYPLYKDTKAKAQAEGCTPVIGLHRSGTKGLLLVIHTDDFETVAREWAKANGLRLVPAGPPKPLRKLRGK